MTPLFRKLLRAAALGMLLGTPAFAQSPHINMMPDAKTRTPEEIERDEKADRAYRESLRKIPDAKGAIDPWGDVRGTDAAPRPAAKAKTTQPKSAKAAPAVK